MGFIGAVGRAVSLDRDQVGIRAGWVGMLIGMRSGDTLVRMKTVTDQQFVAAWNSSTSRDEVAQKTGLAPASVTDRAAALRRKGYDLPKWGKSKMTKPSQVAAQPASAPEDDTQTSPDAAKIQAAKALLAVFAPTPCPQPTWLPGKPIRRTATGTTTTRTYSGRWNSWQASGTLPPAPLP